MTTAKKSLLCGLMVLILLGTCALAFAGARSYFEQKREIKVGMLIMESTGWENCDPYIFYVLDQMTSMKPYGWEFVNPLAPSTVTPQLKARYNEYTLGSQLTKNMAGYWMVYLEATPLEDLLQFDLLFLTNHARTFFYDKDREKLRKLVDQGGQLWIDDCMNLVIGERGNLGISSFFVLDFQFRGQGYGGTDRGHAEVAPGQRLHPILTTPYWLTYPELQVLGDKRVGVYYMTNWAGDQPPDQTVFTPVVLNVPNNQGARIPYPSIVAGRYGSGSIICTSMDIGCGINDSCQSDGPNSEGYFQGEVGRTQPEDVKIAYNIVSWSFAHTAEHKDAQRSGRSFEDLIPPPTAADWADGPTPKGPMLAEKWRFPPRGFPWGAGGGFITSQPVMSKGVIVVGGPDGTLYCFDGEPARDLDNDGNPDDGARDLNDGLPYDLIWTVDVAPGDSLSTPLIVSVAYVDSGIPTGQDLVYVVTRGAKLYAFLLAPDIDQDGRIDETQGAFFGPVSLGDSPSASYSPNAETNGEIPSIPSPVYSEGKLYIAGPSGPLWEIDARGQGTPVQYGALYAGEAQSSPSIAYIRDEFSGAIERVLYVPYAQPESGGGTGGMKSYLLDVRNERLTPGRTMGIFYTRYHYGTDQRGRFDIYGESYPNPERHPRVWRLAGGTGSPESVGFAWQQAQSQFRITGMVVPGDSFYADYSVDPSVSNFWRTREPVLAAASGPDPALSLGGSVAVGSGDLVYYGTKNSLAYCLMDRYLYPKPENEGERDREVAKWRYLLPSNAGSAESGDVPFMGTPAVGDDLVFMTAFARIGDPVPGGWLVAFERDPTIRIRTQREILDPKGVSLRQLSPFGAGAPQSINPDQYTVVSGNEVIIHNCDDPRLGAAITAQKITLPAQGDWPILVRYPSDDPGTMGEGEEHSLGSHPGDHIDPKVWEAFPLPARCSTGPSLIGEYIFVPMDSGDVWVFPANPSKIDPNVRERREGDWPNLGPDGLAWFSVQTEAFAPGDPNTWIGCGLAAANGLLAVSNFEGLIVYDNQHTVVADNNRVIELTPSGRAVWACDATTTSRVAGGDLPISGEDEDATGVIVTETTALSRPRAVRKFGEDSYVVADSGNNRVVQFDKSGTIMWELKGFYDPRRILPAGSPMFLNAPTDFTIYSKTGEYAGGLQLYEVHYVIVDSGNYRILELATGFTPDGQVAEDPMAPGNPFDRVVVWASTTASVGQKYSYSNALRVDLPEIDPNYQDNWLYPVTVACVANTRFGSVGQTYSGGTILFLDSESTGYSQDPGKPIKFGDIPINGSSIVLPDAAERALSAPTHIDLYTVVGNDNSVLANYMWVIADTTTIDNPDTGDPMKVGAIYIVYLSSADGKLHLATDADGNWMEYPVWLDTLHGDIPVPFVHPTCVKKVGSGELLVTDLGANRVLTFDPMTGRGIAIAPPVSGTADLNQPTFADRSF